MAEMVKQGSVAECMDQYLSGLVPLGFSGTVLVAKGGGLLLNKGYGWADRAARQPNCADTIFDIGSVTKQFTAAGILCLEMDGLLTTEQPIAAYLPNVPEDKAGITLHHLLTHTAGMRDTSGDDYEPISREAALERILTAPPFAEPGAEYLYNNDGYTLLAALIETVTGELYEQFIRRRLFVPAGMERTGYRLPDWDESRVAHGYSNGKDQGTPLLRPYPFWNLMGNGGMLSTTEDLFKWHCALLTDTILPDEAREKLYTPFLSNYAYGWVVEEGTQGKVVRHNGGSTYGATAEFARYLDEDLVIVVLSNQYTPEMMRMTFVEERMAGMAFGQEFFIPPQALCLEPAELRLYEGEYRLPGGGRFALRIKDEHLQMRSEDQEAINLMFFAGEDFTLLDELNRLSIAMAEGFLQDEFTLLKEYSNEKEERLARRIHLIRSRRDQFVAEKGPLHHVKSYGVTPSGYLEGALEVNMDLQGELGSLHPIIFWENEQVIAVGFRNNSFAVTMDCAPVSREELFLYHLGNQRYTYCIYNEHIPELSRLHQDDPGKIAFNRSGLIFQKNGSAAIAEKL